MKLSRRAFLIGTAAVGGGLIVGLNMREAAEVPNTRAGSFQPNAWLQILPSGEVIFQFDRAEMGQGVMTGFAQIIGEELDFDPARLQIEFAGVHPAFKNPALQLQLTGGSTSVQLSWEPLRHAAATARAMLVSAAAKLWEVNAEQIRTENGVVSAGTRRAGYGELAALAAAETAPKTVVLKAPADFRYVGKSLPRLDSAAKVKGEAQFGVDVQLAGMKVAVVVRCPHYGGSVKSFDAASVSGLPGVRKVFAIHSGIAIVADGYWPARQAAGQLRVDWDKGPLAGLDSEQIMAGYKDAALNTKKPFNLDDSGNAAQALEASSRVVRAAYSAPFTHHSPMEPQNGTAVLRDGELTLWLSTQTVDMAQAVAAHYSGVASDKIRVNSTFIGGGFGRRGYVDFAGEVAAIAAAMPGVPVKLIWSREDDMRHDYYRPAAYHQLEASLAGSGLPDAWRHRFASTSILSDFFGDMMGALLPKWVPTTLARSLGESIGPVAANYDVTMGEGARIPYAIANRDTAMVNYDAGIPVGFWRSVAHSTNAFAVESFIDELAFEAEADPVEFRRSLLRDKPRHLAVLELAAQKAGWFASLQPAGAGRGVAVHESFGSVVAIVADVLVQDGSFRVQRLVVAADCGRVINPDQVAAQLEGGALYGLTAALKTPVEFADGACVQSNFDDLPVLRCHETPELVTALVASEDKPTGVGEIAVPPVAPAVANAIFAASRRRLRSLPLQLG